MKGILYITYDGLLDPVARSQVLPYLKKLASREFNISVISFEKNDKLERHAALDARKDELKGSGIGWFLLRYHKRPAIPATIMDIFSGYFTGIRCMLKNNVKIIHARGYIPALIGVMLKGFSGRKLIFDMRGFWPDEKVDGGAWGRKSALYHLFNGIERFLVNRSDEVVVLSEAAMKRLKTNHPGARVTVIPCCVDLDLFGCKPGKSILPENAKNRTVLIYLGSSGTFYDLEGSIAFFKYFKKIRKDAFFRVATNSDAEEVKGAVKNGGIDPEDYAVENLDFADVPGALCGSDMSVMFYKRELSGAGCSPIKFAESLSCGLPVVINSGIGDTGEIIEKEGIGVVLDNSPGNYERASREALALVDGGDTVKKKCRAAAENYFSLASGVDKYMELYQRL